MVSINLQNDRTRFTEAVETFDQRLRDILNDIETGYYPSANNFSCSLNASNKAAIAAPIPGQTQGKNKDCTFLGKAVQISPGTDVNAFNVFTIVGSRTINDSGVRREVKNLEEAQPTGIKGASNGSFGVIDTGVLSGGLQFTRVLYKTGPTTYDPMPAGAGGFAIMSGLGQPNPAIAGGLESGIVRMSLASIDGTVRGQQPTTFADRIDGIGTPNTIIQGVLICLNEQADSNGRRASILLGGQGQKTATVVQFDNNVPAECGP